MLSAWLGQCPAHAQLCVMGVGLYLAKQGLSSKGTSATPTFCDMLAQDAFDGFGDVPGYVCSFFVDVTEPGEVGGIGGGS